MNRSPEDWAAQHLEEVPLDEPKPNQNRAADDDFAARLREAAPPELGEWDAGDDQAPPPPRGWLLGTTFCRGFLSSVIAEGGSGKTTLRYAQYIALATGRPLTGERVFQRCRVLIVSLEDNADELRRRILAARMHHNVSLDELRGWLFLSAPGAGVGKLMTVNRRGRAELGPLAGVLERAIDRRKPDLIALDPFIRSHGVGENDNTMIDQVAQVLVDLAAKHNLAVDAPHHVRKSTPEPGNADRGRGASAQRDASRLVYSLTVMTAAEAEMFAIPEEERRLYFRVDSAKVNIAPPSLKAKWFKLIGVKLDNANELYPNGDEVQTVAPWHPPATFDGFATATCNRILDEIDKGLADGERYSDESAAKMRHAWRAVKIHAPDKTEKQCREVIKQWMKTGVLVREPYYSQDRREDVMGLRANSAKRPGLKTEWSD